MSYDWEKIFENKTNKELYDIYSGNSMLPIETIEYARNELERRNFDFNDINNNRSAWELSELLIEVEQAQQVLKENRVNIIPYKSLYFLIPGILVVYFVLLIVFKINLTILFPILMLGLTLWYVPFTHRIYARQIKKQKNRIENIIKLNNKLKENLSVDKLNPIKEDIDRIIQENDKKHKVIIYILNGIFLILLFVKIIVMIVEK
jgi:hypothetical protein